MRNTSFKSRPVQQFLAASAVFLAIGGSAVAQTQSQPQASPGQPGAEAQQPGHGGRHGDHGGHGHRGHHPGAMWMQSADTDRDGAISKAEADTLFGRIDANQDGKLDREELRAYQRAEHAKHRAQMRERFDAQFKAADKDGDGALSKREAEAGMPGMAKRFDRLDANKDGKVTRDEIGNAMRQAHAKRMNRGGNPANGALNPAAPSSEGG